MGHTPNSYVLKKAGQKSYTSIVKTIKPGVFFNKVTIDGIFFLTDVRI